MGAYPNHHQRGFLQQLIALIQRPILNGARGTLGKKETKDCKSQRNRRHFKNIIYRLIQTGLIVAHRDWRDSKWPCIGLYTHAVALFFSLSTTWVFYYISFVCVCFIKIYSFVLHLDHSSPLLSSHFLPSSPPPLVLCSIQKGKASHMYLLVRVSIAVKRHHHYDNPEKGKHSVEVAAYWFHWSSW